MKRNKIIFGTAGIIAIAAVVVTSTSDLGKTVGLYQERDLSFIQSQSVDDYEKWIEARYIDQETGQKITAEKLTLIRKQIAKLPKSMLGNQTANNGEKSDCSAITPKTLSKKT